MVGGDTEFEAMLLGSLFPFLQSVSLRLHIDRIPGVREIEHIEIIMVHGDGHDKSRPVRGRPTLQGGW